VSAWAREYIVLGAAIVVVVAAVVAGLMVLGSPAEERMRRLDEKRLQDLNSLTYMANTYWTANGRLPASLDEMMPDSSVNPYSRDPNTGQPYGYRPIGDKMYELCADFQHEADNPPPDAFNRIWSHGVGRRCFQLEAKRSNQ